MLKEKTKNILLGTTLGAFIVFGAFVVKSMVTKNNIEDMVSVKYNNYRSNRYMDYYPDHDYDYSDYASGYGYLDDYDYSDYASSYGYLDDYDYSDYASDYDYSDLINEMLSSGYIDQTKANEFKNGIKSEATQLEIEKTYDFYMIDQDVKDGFYSAEAGQLEKQLVEAEYSGNDELYDQIYEKYISQLEKEGN
ncbi:hypothetical protein [Candidatus Arthromitus sp. SFB-rat-Yit]|uniref:hypothetical protein n=1 Tax=Candidatus Arthromitus sp. SFB-rat-Yit TaxID=1041504 RepID=UPI000227A564|nr:hypothetical protein [Candidatus Arthromitus sp. SFB-rat-Yit]BAK81016.1 hypothetical protein RATSFB_0454 [Candidatus Arthromitus sp. SFB-rat-Yit]